METETKNEPQGRPISRPSDLKGSVKAAVNVIVAVADCIRELRTVPSGHLYARLMGHLSIDDYQSVIATLIRAGLVHEHPSHLLEWIGPSGPTATNNN
jgi:hypothetical protein